MSEIINNIYGNENIGNKCFNFNKSVKTLKEEKEDKILNYIDNCLESIYF